MSHFLRRLNTDVVENVPCTGDVVFIVEHSEAVDSTGPVKVCRSTRRASFEGRTIIFVDFMYKKQPSDKKFEDKAFKLALKAKGPKGNTIGKIHVNFAQYAVIPSASKKITAQLSNGSAIAVRIEGNFIGTENKRIPESRAEAKGTLTDFGEDGDFSSHGDEDENTHTDERRSFSNCASNESVFSSEHQWSVLKGTKESTPH